MAFPPRSPRPASPGTALGVPASSVTATGPIPEYPLDRLGWQKRAACIGAWREVPDARGVPDGKLLHLRDTYPIETAWAPRYDTAAQQRELADSYHALHHAYRQCETVFAAAMADRADWEAATRAQRHLPWPPTPNCVTGIRSSGSPRFVRPNRRPLRQTLAERQTQAFPPWPGPAKAAIRQPPKPEIRPSPEVLRRAADRDADREAAN